VLGQLDSHLRTVLQLQLLHNVILPRSAQAPRCMGVFP